jgi:hypothetical protein
MIRNLIGTVTDAVAPWLKPALAIGGVLLIAACVALYYRAEAATAREEAAAKALKDSEAALTIMRAQHAAAAAVAETLLSEREKDRAIARQNVGKTLNAPIDQNNVVPGALLGAIGGLRDSDRR